MSGLVPWTDWETAYREYAPGLLAFLCGRLGDAAWAEDILHDLFLAYRRQEGTPAPAAPKAYLYQAAHRLSLNALRDGQAAHKARLEFARRQAFRVRAGADPLRAEALREALAALPEAERSVVTLRAFAGLTFEELAELLGAPLGTVYKRHARAMAALRKALA